MIRTLSSLLSNHCSIYWKMHSMSNHRHSLLTSSESKADLCVSKIRSVWWELKSWSKRVSWDKTWWPLSHLYTTDTSRIGLLAECTRRGWEYSLCPVFQWCILSTLSQSLNGHVIPLGKMQGYWLTGSHNITSGSIGNNGWKFSIAGQLLSILVSVTRWHGWLYTELQYWTSICKYRCHTLGIKRLSVICIIDDKKSINTMIERNSLL